MRRKSRDTRLTTIGFDADDTLWQNEAFFRITQDRIADLLADYSAANSMKSDVLPALEAGAWGVFVPQGLTWQLEHASAPADHPRFRELTDLSGVLDLVRQIES